jgi:hypothetical protein
VSGATRVVPIAVPKAIVVLLVAGVAALAIGVAGCGKYGKPVRTAPEPPEQAFRRAEDAEKRYTLNTSLESGTQQAQVESESEQENEQEQEGSKR